MNGLTVSTLCQRTPCGTLSASPVASESGPSAPRPGWISRSGRTGALRLPAGGHARLRATPPGPRRLRLRWRPRRSPQPAHHLRRRWLPDHDRPQLHRLVAVRASPAVDLKHAMQQLAGSRRPTAALLGPGARRRSSAFTSLSAAHGGLGHAPTRAGARPPCPGARRCRPCRSALARIGPPKSRRLQVPVPTGERRRSSAVTGSRQASAVKGRYRTAGSADL